MILDADLPELNFFRKAETRSRLRLAREYEGLVVANGNDRLPIHRWFRFKESFSADLLKKVLGDLELRRNKIRLLDPFCGVGTSLVASQELSLAGYFIEATGIERNPFISFVAKTKVNWPNMDAKEIRHFSSSALASPSASSQSLPRNSSFLTSRCMTTYMARRLMGVAERIRALGTGHNRQALMLGLASAIEPLSKTRKDGRALRIVAKPQTRMATILADRWDAIAEDIGLMQRTVGKVPIPKVLHGDGRRPSSKGLAAGSHDLVFTSPPYPNNIDYTEVYKLELWLLGYVTSAKEFLDLRPRYQPDQPVVCVVLSALYPLVNLLKRERPPIVDFSRRP